MARATSSASPDATEGHRFLPPAQRFGITIDRLGERRADQPRGHRVDPDAVGGPLLRELPAQHDQRRLGRRVSPQPRKRIQRGDRSHGDDRAAALRERRVHARASSQVARTSIANTGSQSAGLERRERRAPCDARVRHQHVEAAAALRPRARQDRCTRSRPRGRRATRRPRRPAPRARPPAHPAPAPGVDAAAAESRAAGRARAPIRAARSRSRGRCRRWRRSPARAAGDSFIGFAAQWGLSAIPRVNPRHRASSFAACCMGRRALDHLVAHEQAAFQGRG